MIAASLALRCLGGDSCKTWRAAAPRVKCSLPSRVPPCYSKGKVKTLTSAMKRCFRRFCLLPSTGSIKCGQG